MCSKPLRRRAYPSPDRVNKYKPRGAQRLSSRFHGVRRPSLPRVWRVGGMINLGSNRPLTTSGRKPTSTPRSSTRAVLRCQGDVVLGDPPSFIFVCVFDDLSMRPLAVVVNGTAGGWSPSRSLPGVLIERGAKGPTSSEKIP